MSTAPDGGSKAFINPQRMQALGLHTLPGAVSTDSSSRPSSYNTYDREERDRRDMDIQRDRQTRGFDRYGGGGGGGGGGAGGGRRRSRSRDRDAHGGGGGRGRPQINIGKYYNACNDVLHDVWIVRGCHVNAMEIRMSPLSSLHFSSLLFFPPIPFLAFASQLVASLTTTILCVRVQRRPPQSGV